MGGTALLCISGSSLCIFCSRDELHSEPRFRESACSRSAEAPALRDQLQNAGKADAGNGKCAAS